MKSLFKTAVFIMILATYLSSCGRANGAGAATTGAPANGTVDPDAKFYVFTLDPAAAAAGKETPIRVTVNPADGYKWNDEYPATFVVSGGAGLALGKTEFKTTRKDIHPAGKKATFTVPVTADHAGRYTLTLKGGFSVCNDTSCKIFRKKSIDLQFDAN